MIPKIKLFCIAKVTILMIAISIQSCKNAPQTLDLNSTNEMISWNDSVKFESDPFNKKIKAVTYLQTDAIFEMERWIPYITSYPEVSFLFYFNSTDKEYIKNYLAHTKFPIPVFIDTKNKYKNYLLISFIINEKNEIIAISNPSLPDYEMTLKRMKN